MVTSLEYVRSFVVLLFFPLLSYFHAHFPLNMIHGFLKVTLLRIETMTSKES